MRGCKKMRNSLYKLALLLGLCFCTSVAIAEGIAVTKTEGRLVEDGYEISANYNINLSPSVADALTRGVVLNLSASSTITRSRWYWLDSDVIQDEQQIKLSYNPLTSYTGFPKEPCSKVSQIWKARYECWDTSRPLPCQPQLLVGAAVMWQNFLIVKQPLRLSHNYAWHSELPKPLQVYALTNSDWKLESERVSWPVQPEMTENNEASKPCKYMIRFNFVASLVLRYFICYNASANTALFFHTTIPAY